MTASEELRALVNGFRVSQAVHVAAVLRISDVLADGPVGVEAVARSVAADPASLRRLLRALAAVGVYVETEDGRFANNELSEALRTGSGPMTGTMPQSMSGPMRAPLNSSMNGWATFIGEPYHWSSWGNLLQSIRTGETAFTTVYGMDVWAYRAEDPTRTSVFDAAMTDIATTMAAAVSAAYDFPGDGVLVDVGGGRGALLAAVLAERPGLSGVVFDLPHVIVGADQALADNPARDRIRLEAGDMFQAVPADADVYLLKSVLHDWPDDDCERILDVCRSAMSSSSVVLIVERLLAGRNEGADTKFSDLNMLVMTGGRERSENEFIRILGRSGLRHRRTVETASPWSVIEAGIA